MSLLLPIELWFDVFEHLDVESLYSLYWTNKDFRLVIVENDEAIFKPIACKLSPMGLADPLEDESFWVDNRSKWLNSCLKHMRKSKLFKKDYAKTHISSHDVYEIPLERPQKCKIVAAIPFQSYARAHEPLYTQKLYYGYSTHEKSFVVEKELNSGRSRRASGTIFCEVTRHKDTEPVLEFGSRHGKDRILFDSVPLPAAHSRRTNKIVGTDPYIIIGSSDGSISGICTITVIRNKKCIFHIDYPTGNARRVLINNRFGCVVEKHRMRMYHLYSSELIVDRTWTGLNFQICSLTDTHFLMNKRFSGTGWYTYPLEALVNPRERFLERAPIERRLLSFPPTGYSLDAGVIHCYDRFVILNCMTYREIIVYDALTNTIGRYNHISKSSYSSRYSHSVPGFWFFGEDGGVYGVGSPFLDAVVDSLPVE